MLEIRHLRSLVAIADAGKLATAAERVHLSQSALSHQIRALEDHHGLALFERTRQGLQFTPAGERLLTLARSVLGEVSAAERDLQRMKGETTGELRIALECHTCFDWLMPVMHAFRQRWPEVEVDLVAGFHAEPLALLKEGRADLVVGSAPKATRAWQVSPLFRFEMMLVVANDHPLRHKRFVTAKDLADETLITYPVPDARIDLIREVLTPAKVNPARRTAELTVAIVQLVASRRGVAALPSWGLQSYLEHDYVQAVRIGPKGLWSELHAICPKAQAARPYMQDMAEIIRQQCAQLPGIEWLA
ncbi:LysR family transcriptional regulator [Aquabacterium fontiphilum]|uniref:LysR family transcriptional regulator n=1 Tax=Aquabacterium fontiphilum TaxID=450365 RepID=UPI0013783C0B|nr:LysR family transcriptional regulator [Aquabacterium fontiphilum]NBD19458.1 LysR family transcriptional regulator [Aquabacterium fontiphilum]